MTARRPGPARLDVALQALLAGFVIIVFAACGQPDASPPASPSQPAGPTPATGPDPTPVPGGASAAPTPFASIQVGPDRPDATAVGGLRSDLRSLARR